ncbi:hypothetical protein GGI23_000511 [Coemansia sp. RSA 2559]|nr:hypothetical protein GGI23_000511 [Coemansia sp. RSA 2559]KAJ2869071.1 hypothetical protein GGI22_000473 [Coemansia erecta]
MVLIATATITEVVEIVPVQAENSTVVVTSAHVAPAVPATAPVLPESTFAAVAVPVKPSKETIHTEAIEAADTLVKIATALASINPAAAAACLDIADTHLIPPASAPPMVKRAVDLETDDCVNWDSEEVDIPIEDEVFVRPTSSLFLMSDDEDDVNYEPLANTPRLRLSSASAASRTSNCDILANIAPWDVVSQTDTDCSDNSAKQTSDTTIHVGTRIPATPAKLTFDFARARAESRIHAPPTRLDPAIVRARAKLTDAAPPTPVSIYSADGSPASELGGFYD